MALNVVSALPFQGFTVTVTNAACIVLDATALTGISPYSNTKEIIFYNMDPQTDCFVQVADVSAGIPAAGTVTVADSTVIPAGGSVTLAIGAEGDRESLNEAGGAPPLGVVMRGDGADVDVNVTYVQCSGYKG